MKHLVKIYLLSFMLQKITESCPSFELKTKFNFWNLKNRFARKAIALPTTSDVESLPIYFRGHGDADDGFCELGWSDLDAVFQTSGLGLVPNTNAKLRFLINLAFAMVLAYSTLQCMRALLQRYQAAPLLWLWWNLTSFNIWQVTLSTWQMCFAQPCCGKAYPRPREELYHAAHGIPHQAIAGAIANKSKVLLSSAYAPVRKHCRCENWIRTREALRRNTAASTSSIRLWQQAVLASQSATGIEPTTLGSRLCSGDLQ